MASECCQVSYTDTEVSGGIIPGALPFIVSMIQESCGVLEVLLGGARGKDVMGQGGPLFFFSNKANFSSVEAR
jgi:hypothetical protein